jgi:hypothetical protein
MTYVAFVVGVVLISAMAVEVFETMVLPRRVVRRVRLSRWFYRTSWPAWRSVANLVRGPGQREGFLSIYGPLSLLVLFAIWACVIVLGYALVLWSLGSDLESGRRETGFGTALYFSGTTFFTLGLGDVVPVGRPERATVVIEVGMGFALLALLVGYLPVLYQSFARREVFISQLDARAGSPPTAAALLSRHSGPSAAGELDHLLRESERWATEVLESHLSYPSLTYFRSQHDHQSWVASLTVILDVTAVMLASEREDRTMMPQLAFAMARHAAVDIGQIFGGPLEFNGDRRLDLDGLERLVRQLNDAGCPMLTTVGQQTRLGQLRATYEPHLARLGHRLLMDLPPWFPEEGAVDDWQTSAEKEPPLEGDEASAV